MNAYAMLLRQPALERSLKAEILSTVLMMAFAVIGFALTITTSLPRATGTFIAAGFTAICVLIWWGVFLQNALQQNRPSLAVLVPGLRGRLLTLTAALWAAGSLLPALLFGVALGHFGYVLLATAFLLLFVALCTRYVAIAFVPSVLIIASLNVFQDPVRRLIATLTAWGEAPFCAGAFAVLLPVGWLTLRLLFPRGGDRHHAWGEVAAKRARSLKLGMHWMWHDSAGSTALMRPFDMFYAARLLAAGRPGLRLLNGLGPRAHWSANTLSIVTTAVIALASHARLGGTTMRPLVPLLLAAMLIPVGMYVKTLLTVVKDTPGEQSLLRLTPGAAALAGLNRELAAALLRRFGIVWGTYAVCSALVVVTILGAWGVWWFGIALSALLAPWLVRDHARHPGWVSSGVIIGTVMLVMPSVAGIIAYAPVPTWIVAAVAVGVLLGAALLLRQRWIALQAFAPAFPAGRLAA